MPPVAFQNDNGWRECMGFVVPHTVRSGWHCPNVPLAPLVCMQATPRGTNGTPTCNPGIQPRQGVEFRLPGGCTCLVVTFARLNRNVEQEN